MRNMSAPLGNKREDLMTLYKVVVAVLDPRRFYEVTDPLKHPLT